MIRALRLKKFRRVLDEASGSVHNLASSLHGLRRFFKKMNNR